MLLSIVIPVYQAEKIIPELYVRVEKAMEFAKGNYELLLIDDGSTDNSWQKIEDISIEKRNIKVIKLSRNFGQQQAISAGLNNCIGEWIIVMDCDLQDRPEEIEKLHKKSKEGYDIVFAKRMKRKDSIKEKLFSNFFYKLFGYLTGLNYDGAIGNFGIYNRKVIESINKMKEQSGAFSPLVRWVGFNKSYIEVEHGNRFEGKSTYSYKKKVSLAIDIILSYTDKPLKLIIRLGFVISIMSFSVGVYYLTQYFLGNILVSGYTSIIISIWFLSGLLILILGVIGLYISKIFVGVKGRPTYIIEKLKCSNDL